MASTRHDLDVKPSTSATPALRSLGLQSDEEDDDHFNDVLLAGANPQHDLFENGYTPAPEPKPVALTGKNLSSLMVPKRKPKDTGAAQPPAKRAKTRYEEADAMDVAPAVVRARPVVGEAARRPGRQV